MKWKASVKCISSGFEYDGYANIVNIDGNECIISTFSQPKWNEITTEKLGDGYVRHKGTGRIPVDLEPNRTAKLVALTPEMFDTLRKIRGLDVSNKIKEMIDETLKDVVTNQGTFEIQTVTRIPIQKQVSIIGKVLEGDFRTGDTVESETGVPMLVESITRWVNSECFELLCDSQMDPIMLVYGRIRAGNKLFIKRRK